ncbi:MAG: hypothetical protein RIQ89_374 [Bacteroidota bacterium]|jgi:predicted 3-demethylubiquinone-9 3-methyltransferase (glyoxalase superfamily)
MNDPKPKIIPNLWFDGNASDAVAFYMSIFKDGKITNTTYYPTNPEEGLAAFQNELAGKVLTIAFEILGTSFIAINAGPQFKFNEAISLMIPCKNQEEIDFYWSALTADGGEQLMCGWLKDKYGLCWQVCPKNWNELTKKPGAFKKMMGMKKLVIADF